MLEVFTIFKPFSGAPYSCTSCDVFGDVPGLCFDLWLQEFETELGRSVLKTFEATMFLPNMDFMARIGTKMKITN